MLYNVIQKYYNIHVKYKTTQNNTKNGGTRNEKGIRKIISKSKLAN